VIPVKLRVDDISAEAKELSFAEPEADLNRILEQGPLTEFRVNEPIGVKVSFYRAGPELFFEGDLHASTTAICARCAEEFAAPSGRDFRFILAPKAVGFDKENDLRDEDLEFSLYDGDQIDLSPPAVPRRLPRAVPEMRREPEPYPMRMQRGDRPSRIGRAAQP
jgi:uncharacterized metal-binding protein YceD (DUF177 family)